MSVIANDFLTTYKYGWKTSYYQNTYDNKTDEIEEPKEDAAADLLKKLSEVTECDACSNLNLPTKKKTSVEAMTVFNTDAVDIKKQPMFFGLYV